MTKPTEKLLKF